MPTTTMERVLPAKPKSKRGRKRKILTPADAFKAMERNRRRSRQRYRNMSDAERKEYCAAGCKRSREIAKLARKYAPA
jgi:hypothetical protein